MKTPFGQFVTLNGEKFYEIANYDAMQPFFISLATDCDLWMYVASTGGLSCGRRSPDFALFPYYTDDKITQNYTFTGSRTIVRVPHGEQTMVWEVFGTNNDAVYTIERRICKSVTGSTLLFEETNLTLGLRVRYTWQPARQHGWVRRVYIENIAAHAQEFELIDGLQNILPAGVNRQTQNVYSTLVDGYKKTEQVAATPLVLYRMEAIMVDKAEPSESLTCNTVYTIGAEDMLLLTSSAQLEAFRHGGVIHAEPESKGVQGAYLVYSPLTLPAESAKEWMYVMDVEKDASEVRALLHAIAESDHKETILRAISDSTATLQQIVAQNDGVQSTGDEAQDARHFANVLYNTMRGGYFPDHYTIRTDNFRRHICHFNQAVYTKHEAFLQSLPESIELTDLDNRIIDRMDHQLHRLFMEYLPLTFSRRHGDPSRPWNSFDIRLRDAKGNPLLTYQGNWRDIFQNWEALLMSYPLYVNHVIAKFLNATTADGYNPYRITSDGIDWEVINPDDPWSNIGYWGDHQIIYLCKLLELSLSHAPHDFMDLLTMPEFSFAAVPYRIKAYKDIVLNPKDTIRFDDAAHTAILGRVPQYGADAKLLMGTDDQPLLANGAEKILIPLLVKLSNFIPTAGVWMNTLRPEWNDANNALVGNGASMVTAYYMHRYMLVLADIFARAEDTSFAMHEEVLHLLRDLLAAVQNAPEQWSEHTLRAYTDTIGMAGETYRQAAYAGFSGKMVEVPASVLREFATRIQAFLAASIVCNRREDGLYHAYNLVRFTDDARIEVEHLYEMLEGQVAVLSSKLLSAEQAADLIDVMRHSALYRADRQSYMLYPNRRRPSFLEMNNVDVQGLSSEEIEHLLAEDILRKDCDGYYHFAPQYRNANNLPASVQSLYEATFHHHSFTGRSGTFYKYEGLGSIYWHMVSKLQLAVAEAVYDAPEGSKVLERLRKQYFEIKEGIGAHATPQMYGSFPFDAYSHTPSMAGAQQPGMTGQVKEDILSRWMELGLRFENGEMTIAPRLLQDSDFKEDGTLSFTFAGDKYEMGRDGKITKI